jgi:hypothetical protein
MQDLGLTQQQLVLMITVVTTLVAFPFALTLYEMKRQRKIEEIMVFGINIGYPESRGKLTRLPPLGMRLAHARRSHLRLAYRIISKQEYGHMQSIAAYKTVVF